MHNETIQLQKQQAHYAFVAPKMLRIFFSAIPSA